MHRSPYLSLALKNIKKAKQRTLVTTLLGSISTAILIFSTALMDGQHQTLLKSAVEVYPGYIQITHHKFRDNPSYDHLIFDAKKLTDTIQHLPEIDTMSPRFETFVLLSAKDKSVGAMLSGIHPEQEKLLSKLKSSRLSGRYLNQNSTNELYIGNELANNLGVKIGDQIAFIGSAVDYSLAAENVTIIGIFQTGLFEFDNATAFLTKSYFDEIYASHNMMTHLIIKPKQTHLAQPLSNKIQTLINNNINDNINNNINNNSENNNDDNLTSASWQEFMQSMVTAMEIDSIFSYIILAIIFIVVLFVIMIYTLLNIFARTKEIGLLRALGTSQLQVLKMLLLESCLLAFVAAIIGGILGGLLAYYFSINPIELGAEYEEQFKQYNLINSAIPTDFNLLTILYSMLIMFILSILSTLYPIFKITRYQIIQAMKHV